MKTIKSFKEKQVVSFEIFPPRQETKPDAVDAMLSGLTDLKPSFISVTFGAGGSDNHKATTSIASKIKNRHNVESVVHLPCINLSKQNALRFIKTFEENNIENILALRGDKTQDITPNGDFKYASDLIHFIKQNSDLNIIGACYPECHKEARDFETDIENLKTKVDAGTNHLISQMFFDNEYFYSFKDKVNSAGIDVPLQAGIMPVTSKKQIQRMAKLCDVNIPKKLVGIIERYENNNQDLREAGIDYAIEQANDLLLQGVEGIHVYVLNNLNIAQKIHEGIRSNISA